MKKFIPLDAECDERKIQETIAASKAAFLAGEAERTVSHLEFLYLQSRYIQKRWWLLQGLLLTLACALLCGGETASELRRVLGLTGPLFVILILPELWKNRSFEALEVECTTFYTLRSIYAARLTLFAGVDTVLLSVFFAGSSILARITLWEMLVQFLLPFNVTCCICFGTLYARHIRSETLSLLLCVLWAGIWSLLVMNDAVYCAIARPVWAVLLAASFFGMGYTLLRGQKQWQNKMEVKPLWI